MIVYGKEPLQISLPDAVAAIRRRLTNADYTGLESARTLLIFAGEVEQATLDAELTCGRLCRSLTAVAAENFVDEWRGSRRAAPCHVRRKMHSLLDAILRTTTAVDLSIRTPEGFAWYGLFPDAYAQAAEAWAANAPAGSRVSVIGIRSIGTALAAVVAAVLRSRRFDVTDTTIRPSGHPFHRQAALTDMIGEARRALVIDEGPGLSGSSMASVADALVERGFTREAITFFPGHSHGPGPCASHQVRGWWADTVAYVVPWERLRLAGWLASDRLAESARSLLGEDLDGPLRDLGAGRWLDAAQAADDVLSIAPPLEQAKWLARGRTGRAVLFKFAGLAAAKGEGSGLDTMAEQQHRQIADLAHAGFTIVPRTIVHGWLALPWIDGRPLRARDVDRSMLRILGTYIARAARPPLGRAASLCAVDRLRAIIVCNARALLGNWAAECAVRASDALGERISRCELASYGDGRLAPHEWLASNGTIIKLDAGGHVNDHTAVGHQAIVWDIAGAAIEWNLGRDALRVLTREAGAAMAGPEILAYYCSAYAALRAGIAELCGVTGTGNDPKQQRRFALALEFYRAHLAIELQRLDDWLPKSASVALH